MKRRFGTYSRNGKDASGRRIQYCCAMCTRTLDDCLFVDEETKMFTPYCKVCRKLLKEGVHETPPKPRLINQEKTAYVLPSPNQDLSNQSEIMIPKDFAVWNNKLQKVIINKDHLAGVLPCVTWSNCTDKNICETAFKATLVFHRQFFSQNK